MSAAMRARAFGAGLMGAATINVALFGMLLPEAAFPFSLQFAWIAVGYFIFRYEDRLLLRNFVL